jgi:hypothetical protein
VIWFQLIPSNTEKKYEKSSDNALDVLFVLNHFFVSVHRGRPRLGVPEWRWPFRWATLASQLVDTWPAGESLWKQRAQNHPWFIPQRSYKVDWNKIVRFERLSDFKSYFLSQNMKTWNKNTKKTSCQLFVEQKLRLVLPHPSHGAGEWRGGHWLGPPVVSQCVFYGFWCEKKQFTKIIFNAPWI